MPKPLRDQKSPADQRVVVMMTREERATLDAKAAGARMNVSQFVRWRTLGESDPDMAELVGRLEALEAHVASGRGRANA